MIIYILSLVDLWALISLAIGGFTVVSAGLLLIFKGAIFSFNSPSLLSYLDLFAGFLLIVSYFGPIGSFVWFIIIPLLYKLAMLLI